MMHSFAHDGRCSKSCRKWLVNVKSVHLVGSIATWTRSEVRPGPRWFVHTDLTVQSFEIASQSLYGYNSGAHLMKIVTECVFENFVLYLVYNDNVMIYCNLNFYWYAFMKRHYKNFFFFFLLIGGPMKLLLKCSEQ